MKTEKEIRERLHELANKDVKSEEHQAWLSAQVLALAWVLGVLD
jgi:hypothetical protein